ATHPFEVVDRPLDAGRAGDREVMQHGIGRAAGRHDQGNGVLDGLARDDVARLEIFFYRLEQHARRLGCRIGLLRVGCRELRGGEQAHAQRLERRAHGVRRVLTAAGADAGAGILLDALEILAGHLAGAESADRLERTDDGELLTFLAPGLDGAGVYEKPRHVDPRHGHHGAGHVLVAAADAQHTVHALAVHRGLDRIGYHLAR